jgi:hypothetical protein
LNNKFHLPEDSAVRFVASSTIALILLSRALPAEEPKPIDLIIHGRAIEEPVLQYRLLPGEEELKSGNAVPILLRLPWEQTQWMNQVFPTLQEWDSRPLDAPEWAATSDGVLPLHFFNEMKRAAFRREASWEYPIGETSSLYFILLPDLQGLRGFLRYGLSARIRYHLSRGELDQAREGILVGLANARHLAQTPFYVNQLVALAIHRAMLDRVAELISQSDCPNLYWALAALPDSLIELERTASLEASAFAMILPAVRDLDRPRDAAEWSRMGEQLLELIEDEFRDKQAVSAPQLLGRWAKAARAELPALLGILPGQVAAMSDEEASIRWYVHQRLALDQRGAAAVVLHPREAWPLLHQLRKDATALHEKTGTKTSGFFDPDVLYVSAWSLKRKIQSLRAIEAVRHYLATHDGKLPARLDDIRGIPVPYDPMTDQPFRWKTEGKTAVLQAPSLAAEVLQPDWATALENRLEYRLEVK